MSDSDWFRDGRVSTGMDDMDVVLEGGYPCPGSTVLIGPSSNEKNAFAFHFAHAAKKSGDALAYISLDHAPWEIESKSESMGLGITAFGNACFVDGYSKALGGKPEGRHDIMVPGPGSLNDISLAVNDVLASAKGKRVRMVFHSLSTMCLYSQPENVLKFVQVIHGKAKAANAAVLWLVDDGMHDRKFIAGLEGVADLAITMAQKQGEIGISVQGLDLELRARMGPAGIEYI
jgi:KaiC/GvpD/RAD55 family RecA-like ATPase